MLETVTLVLMLCIPHAFAAASDGARFAVDPTAAVTSGSASLAPTVFATIGDALAAVPADNDRPLGIFIRNGTYREKLRVDKPFVHLLGESRQGTVITFDANGDSPGPDGNPLGTRGSFTLQVTAPHFRAERLTIENSFDYAANAALGEDDPGKVKNPQGVALMLSGDSDQAILRDVRISGAQDTLFVDAGRSYFHRSTVVGHVDFIFGAGQAVFEACDIVSRNRPGKNPTGYVTAPSTPAQYPYGFLFLDCRLLKESEDVPPASVRLGRPWHPEADPRVNGSAVFVNCYMDDHVGPEGYAPISARNAAGERVWFETGPESRFFEFGSHGPGGGASPARPVLTNAAARWYTVENVLNGWSPQP